MDTNNGSGRFQPPRCILVADLDCPGAIATLYPDELRQGSFSLVVLREPVCKTSLTSYGPGPHWHESMSKEQLLRDVSQSDLGHLAPAATHTMDSTGVIREIDAQWLVVALERGWNPGFAMYD